MATRFSGECPLPLVVTGVSTAPRIFEVANTQDDGDFYPLIGYVTKIDLKNYNALAQENQNIRTVLGHVLPGITKYNKQIKLSAYNKQPTVSSAPPSLDFTWKLK